MARALRRDSTDVEPVLWSALRSRKVACTFRRQHPLPPSVADVACPEARPVVGLDGGQHGGARDAARDAALAAAGWPVRRYWNSAVVENLDGVVADIVAHATRRCQARCHAPLIHPSPPFGWRGLLCDPAHQ
jgi:primosomal protein N' (replication factor Y)